MAIKEYRTRDNATYWREIYNDGRESWKKVLKNGKDGTTEDLGEAVIASEEVITEDLGEAVIASEKMIIDFNRLKKNPAEMISTIKRLTRSDSFDPTQQHYRLLYISSSGNLAHSDRIVFSEPVAPSSGSLEAKADSSKIISQRPHIGAGRKSSGSVYPRKSV